MRLRKRIVGCALLALGLTTLPACEQARRYGPPPTTSAGDVLLT